MNKPEEYKNKIKYFWYYYKIPAIIVLAVLAAGFYLFLTKQQTIRSDYDIAVVSPQGLADEQLERINRALASAGTDQNGDGRVEVKIHVYRFAIGQDGQDMSEIARLDADLVGKQSGIFFTEDPEQFEVSTNGIGKAADALPVRSIPALSGCGIDDLYLLVRTGADEKYRELISKLGD